MESPDDKQTSGSVVRLPGIREDATPSTPALQEPGQEFVYTGISLVGAQAAPLSPPPPSTAAASSMSTPLSSKLSLQAPSTPRIDISRASSSSHHEDSRDTSPERELFEGHDPASAKLGLGFREEGTLDLRSSTEELDFQDPLAKSRSRSRPQSPCLQDDSTLGHGRKDSQSSDIVLLSISGRTSRLSSIGSQGSAHSRLSNASHLSVISGQSGVSRSPSPHKMLLETSFCGAKPPKSTQPNADEQPGTKVETEALEKALLSRKHDPTEAILAEGISLEQTKSVKQVPEKPARKIEKNVQNVKSDITITVDKPPNTDSNNVSTLPRTYVSSSGVEYTYIPLKGPLPPPSVTQASATRTKTREVKSASVHSKPASKGKANLAGKPKAKSATPSPVTHKRDEEPKYIRIKLKPDHLYDDDDRSSGSAETQKQFSLNLNDTSKKPAQSFAEIIRKDSTVSNEQINVPSKSTDSCQGKSLSNTPSASPKLSRHIFPKDVGSKTPSPSLSRKSSFCSLFKSRETIVSPESPTVPSSKRKNTLTGILREASDSICERRRSRSKSRDRDKSGMSVAPSSTESIDSKSKQKSVFSIFKPKKGDKSKTDIDSSASPEKLPSLEGLANVEFKFNSDSNSKGHRSRTPQRYYDTPLEGDSIRIPLHSPTENCNILQELKTSSQDSQETVIEVTSHTVNAVVESHSITESKKATVSVQNQNNKIDRNNRQSSTSSENIVFSTKLGSNNEIFTTKLPKNKQPVKVNIEETLEIQEKIACPVHSPSVPKVVNEIKKTQSSSSLSKDSQNNTKESNSKNNLFQENKFETNFPKTNEKRGETKGKNRVSTVSSIADDDHNSSESERDSEFEFIKNKKDLKLKLEEAVVVDAIEPERKGLVLQQDSFEDELPYVPTTLPQERSVAIPIVPIKQRSTFEMKTCPIERPRSTTPINPSCLEEYCEEIIGSVNTENITKTIEKLKISLPLKDESSERHSKAKSPRKTSSNSNWAAFAEKGIAPRRSSLTQEETTPPPLPPKGVQKEWINFEEIPERRKPPKRIQTIPSRGNIEVPETVLQENVVYSYVNPEDCKCECHEINARKDRKAEEETVAQIQEDEVPLLEDDPGDEDKSTTETFDRIKLDIAIDSRSIIR